VLIYGRQTTTGDGALTIKVATGAGTTISDSAVITFTDTLAWHSATLTLTETPTSDYGIYGTTNRLLAADEAVELLESTTGGGPRVERADR